MIRTERTYGGGTRRIVTMTEHDPMAESARFVALEREAARLVSECEHLTDEAIAANAAGNVDRARELAHRGNAALRQARKLRAEMAAA